MIVTTCRGRTVFNFSSYSGGRRDKKLTAFETVGFFFFFLHLSHEEFEFSSKSSSVHRLSLNTSSLIIHPSFSSTRARPVTRVRVSSGPRGRRRLCGFQYFFTINNFCFYPRSRDVFLGMGFFGITSRLHDRTPATSVCVFVSNTRCS